MKAGTDIAHHFPGLFLVHHNKPGQKVASHAHSEHHLLIPLKGEMSVRAQEKLITIGPGRMIYVPSDVPHEFVATNSREGERLICMVDDKIWKRTKAKFAFGAYPCPQLTKELLFYLLLNPKSPHVKVIIELFVRTLTENMAAGESLGAGESIQHLLSRAQDERVKKAVEFLENNFASAVKSSELAKRAGLSERNLQRLFVAELGIGPKEALTRLRLEEARRLLQEEKVSVTESALRVGYQSLSRFIQAFRDTFGQLPSEV